MRVLVSVRLYALRGLHRERSPGMLQAARSSINVTLILFWMFLLVLYPDVIGLARVDASLSFPTIFLPKRHPRLFTNLSDCTLSTENSGEYWSMFNMLIATLINDEKKFFLQCPVIALSVSLVVCLSWPHELSPQELLPINGLSSVF